MNTSCSYLDCHSVRFLDRPDCIFHCPPLHGICGTVSEPTLAASAASMGYAESSSCTLRSNNDVGTNRQREVSLAVIRSPGRQCWKLSPKQVLRATTRDTWTIYSCHAITQSRPLHRAVQHPLTRPRCPTEQIAIIGVDSHLVEFISPVVLVPY
jgi:hypothetical protein